jgi:hypothetical protein
MRSLILGIVFVVTLPLGAGVRSCPGGCSNVVSSVPFFEMPGMMQVIISLL